MKCPFCGRAESKVLDSRAMDDGSTIRRRRACEECGERFTTFERYELVPPTVVKRDGTVEEFSRNKIYNSILKACVKRAVHHEQIESIVAEAESFFANTPKREIQSADIGEFIMDKLKTLDDVAYVRFASVYRRFADVDAFMGELEKMLREKD